MEALKTGFNYLRRGVKSLTGIAIVLALWWYWPTALKSVMDGNLAILEFATGFLPGTHGPQTETALRALDADSYLLFAEASLLVGAGANVGKGALRRLWRLWRRKPAKTERVT
jgi:hypothetical protein